MRPHLLASQSHNLVLVSLEGTHTYSTAVPRRRGERILSIWQELTE